MLVYDYMQEIEKDGKEEKGSNFQNASFSFPQLPFLNQHSFSFNSFCNCLGDKRNYTHIDSVLNFKFHEVRLCEKCIILNITCTK